MSEYILFLEDHKEDREFYMRAACRRDFTAQGIGALDELEQYLTEYPAKSRASLYVLDGRFPRKKGGAVACLVGEAITMIRKANPKAAMLVYSNSDEAEAIAQRADVSHLHKLGSSMETLFERIRACKRQNGDS